MQDGAKTPEVRLPLNLGLNDGTYAPQACVEALRSFTERTDFRNYTTPRNDPLREVIAEVDGVRPEHVFLHNGSGAILKLAVPHLIRSKILSSKRRMLRHAVAKSGCPIITPSFTYSKVPKKAAEIGLTVEMIPLQPSQGFELDVDELERRLAKNPGLVYLVNPNNPTGNLLIDRERLVSLVEKFEDAIFWVDEAYVQYVDPARHRYVSDLVPKYPNLVVGRSFSFAWGLAGIRIGYLLASPDTVDELESKITDYRLGTVAEAVGIAALRDEEHLPFIRRANQEGIAQLRAGFDAFDAIEHWPSEANFVLARFTDGRSGAWLKSEFEKHQIKIKIFEPANGVTYEPYFRITVGLPHENGFLLERMREILQP